MESEERYIQFAETLNELLSLERSIRNKRRLMESLKKDLDPSECDGSFATDFTAHAFKQLSERLEELALENPKIFKDVFPDGSPSESLLLPSNLKSFIITLIADARKKGHFKEEESKNTSGGVEYRYTIDMRKWSNDKTLQLVVIVENNCIKTGFFNWVQK